MSEGENFFKVLGVAETCTNDEVKLAYLKLAKQFHPDLNHSPDATAKFKSISSAYEALKSEHSRSTYITRQYQHGYTNEYSSYQHRGNGGSAGSYDGGQNSNWSSPGAAASNNLRRHPGLGSVLRYFIVPAFVIVTVCVGFNWASLKSAPKPAANAVEAWYNTKTKRWETPAPWNADYKKSVLSTPTQLVDKNLVHNTSRK